MKKGLVEIMGGELGLDIQSYSGRAMYGKKCLAVYGDAGSAQSTLLAVINYLIDSVADESMERAEASEVAEELLGYRQDSMGLGVVYYWPGVEYKEKEEEEN